MLPPHPHLATFCHFRIDFNSFTPKIFASLLILDSIYTSVVFAEIFASPVDQVWELGSCCRVNEIGKIRSKGVGWENEEECRLIN